MKKTKEKIKTSVASYGDKLSDSIDAIKEYAKPVAEKAKDTVVKKTGQAKETIDEKIAAMKEEKPNVICLKNSEIHVLIPKGYEKTKLKKQNKDEVAYTKETSSSKNVLTINHTDWKDSMLSIDEKTVFELTRKYLLETQGIIEIGTGVTERGEKYGYHILKELSNEFPGATYAFRMNIGNEDDVIDIQAYFIEIGMTGMRDSIGLEYARRAGLVSIEDGKMVGWTSDPYDPEYTKGKLKNLSENPFMDAMFPDHPLSQARELFLALIKDQLIIPRPEETKPTEATTEDAPKEERSEEEIAEMLKKVILEGAPRFETETIDVEPEKPKKVKLDDQLTEAVAEYNAAYTVLNDFGTKLYFLRERSIDALNNVEVLVNSIANHPKSFDTELNDIKFEKTNFTSAKEYAENELTDAKNAALGVGAGAGAGLAAASIAPTAAMWVATTFGTASTGTAIATLSGAAMQNAALAWLGGGALAAGGGGMAAGGQVLLILAGPLGVGIAGVSFLASVLLFAKKKIAANKGKIEEIEAIKTNTQALTDLTEKIINLLGKTSDMRDDTANAFTACLASYGKAYDSLDDKAQADLTALVNKAKSLSALLNEDVK